MTTPQDQLYQISYRLSNLAELLVPSDGDSLMDRIDMIDEELKKIDRMQNQLALIIKLLGKHE